MDPVYIRSAELGAPFSDKPRMPLRDTMLQAGRRAISSAGLRTSDIDALFVAAMGSFAHEQFMGALPLWLADAAGLNADVAPMMIGSSETGAWALRTAFQAMRHDDDWKNVLIIAGEQMNPLANDQPASAEAQLDERRARNRTISEVVDESDRRYGLNMVRMSDIVMDLQAHLHDWSLADLTDLILPFLALEKYRRVRRYPFGQFHNNSYETLAQHHSRPPITRYFRIDDVSPTSSGAVAVVLSRNPEGPRRAVEIVGMGQGYVPASLAHRAGDPAVVGSIRQAYGRACRDAGLGLGWLLDCDFAIIHDPFPSIEYAFLAELGLGPTDIVRRLLSGWSNPFGGLKGCGHALGASGLLQVAKAFHAFTDDPRYIDQSKAPPRSPFPELVRQPPFDTCFTTSVGGVLTNVVVTLLRAAGASERATSATEVVPPSSQPEPRENRVVRVLARTRLQPSAAFGDDVNPLTTESKTPWIYWLDDRGPRTATRSLAYAETRFEPGDAVTVSNRKLDELNIQHVDGLAANEERRPFTIERMNEERVRGLILVERRFHELGHRDESMLRFLAEPRLMSDVYLEYASMTVEGAHSVTKARLVREAHGKRCGRAVVLHRLPGDAPDATAVHARWMARAAVRHPALADVLEVGRTAQGPFLARDHVAGTPLSSWLRGAAVKPQHALVWAASLADALARLHAVGQPHGQVNTRNVVVKPSGRVVLLESFGLADAGVQQDVRGLGGVLLALATGSEAARGEGPARRLEAVRQGGAWAIGLATIIEGCLGNSLYTRADDVAAALGPLAAAARVEWP